MAEQPSPLITRNQLPFSFIHGLPTASPAKLLKQDHSRVISSLNINNTLIAESSADEQLLLDAENWNLNLLLDYALNDSWMLRVQLPYVIYTGGMFDASIDNYHQALGLSRDIRPFYPDDQLSIQYLDNNHQFILDSRQASLGDISFQLAWQHKRSSEFALSHWISIKMPTGDAEKLTGSGAVDLAAWSAMNYRFSETRWLYTQLGILLMGDSDVIQQRQKQLAAFAYAGMKFEPWNGIELKAQLDTHSPLYNSGLRMFDHSVQLSFGGSYIINETHQLDISASEDIYRGSAPDINLNISWWIKY